jgi:hypothetical protein
MGGAGLVGFGVGYPDDGAAVNLHEGEQSLFAEALNLTLGAPHDEGGLAGGKEIGGAVSPARLIYPDGDSVRRGGVVGGFVHSGYLTWLQVIPETA